MGERRHEIDAYLLDNRNRTQKWDESKAGKLKPEIAWAEKLGDPHGSKYIDWKLKFSSARF